MATKDRVNLLDPAAVSRAEALGVITRQIVEGYRVGEHRSPFHGFAIEFAQHREYTMGDDVRHLDWKVLGRSDRYYIKQYEQDTNFVAHLVLDGSESMAYGRDPAKLTKFQYGKVLTACLAHVILGQRDAVSVAIVDEKVREQIARTDNPGKIHTIMQRLAESEPTGGTRLGKALEDIAVTVRSRGIIVVISDLFDDEEGFQRGLQRLRFKGSEVILFHVLDPDEIEFSFKGTVKFVGLEGAPTLQTTPADIRKSYLKAFGEFRQRVRRICERAGCHYVLADTGHPLSETLSGYLAFRQNARRR
jgi:uncharacterized protein (DUF58 family)